MTYPDLDSLYYSTKGAPAGTMLEGRLQPQTLQHRANDHAVVFYALGVEQADLSELI